MRVPFAEKHFLSEMNSRERMPGACLKKLTSITFNPTRTIKKVQHHIISDIQCVHITSQLIRCFFGTQM